MRRIAFVVGLLTLTAVTSAAEAAIITVLPGAFTSPTIETFNPEIGACNVANVSASTGLQHLNLDGNCDFWNYSGGYGLGYTSIIGGIGGDADGYFGSGTTPTTFQFTLPTPSSLFGFYVEEACCFGDERNGTILIDFYDAGSVLLGSTSVISGSNPVWDAFFGFQSTGNGISRVVFSDVGHAVFDNVQWQGQGPTAVPEPASLLLLGTGLTAVAARRRRSRQRA